MSLITISEFSKATKLDKVNIPGLANFLMKLTKISEINRLYDSYGHIEGVEVIDLVLNDCGIKIKIPDQDLNNIPKDGAFVAVANHPFGGLEGLILVKLLASIRPESKVMANFLLKKIPNLSNFFIGVNPFENIKSISSISGMKECLDQLAKGEPLGVFPAGEVSTYDKKVGKITDKRWSPMIGRIISKSQVPVIPIYFKGNNGALFHFLGMINPMLRTAKLPSELFNKKGKTLELRIGKPILPNEYNNFAPKELINILRNKTYDLGSLNTKF